MARKTPTAPGHLGGRHGRVFAHAVLLTRAQEKKGGPRESGFVAGHPTVDLPPDLVKKLDHVVALAQTRNANGKSLVDWAKVGQSARQVRSAAWQGAEPTGGGPSGGMAVRGNGLNAARESPP